MLPVKFLDFFLDYPGPEKPWDLRLKVLKVLENENLG